MRNLSILVFAVLILAASAGHLRALPFIFNTLFNGASLTTGNFPGLNLLVAGRHLLSTGMGYSAYLGEGTFGVYMGYSDSDFVPSRSIWMTPIAYKGRGPWRITMQTDGDLVLYDYDNYVIWRTGTAGKGKNNRVTMQADGNLVMYDERGTAIWDSKGFTRR